MNKVLIGVVAGAIVVAGGAYFVFTSSDKEAATGANEVAGDTQGGKFSGSMKDLMARGGDYRCTIDASTAESISSGVVYVSGQKMRGDFTTSVEGSGTVEGHMISDGEFVYVWSSMMPQGMKMRASAEGDASGSASAQVFDVNHSYSYDCDASQADASLFVVPTNVTFMQIGS